MRSYLSEETADACKVEIKDNIKTYHQEVAYTEIKWTILALNGLHWQDHVLTMISTIPEILKLFCAGLY
jgi:hypothetical protein